VAGSGFLTVAGLEYDVGARCVSSAPLLETQKEVPDTMADRRCFMKGLIPGCLGACVCAHSLSAQAQESPGATSQGTLAVKARHKFDLPERLTHRQHFRLEYADHFIPLVLILEKELGRERVDQILETFIQEESKALAEAVVKAKGKNDLSVFKEEFGPGNKGATELLTLDVVEDTDKAYAIKISECIWAQTWRDAGAAHFGDRAVCLGDILFARAVNPKIDMTLTGTLMQGKDHCLLRYHYV
jgi:hypothetical protein